MRPSGKDWPAVRGGGVRIAAVATSARSRRRGSEISKRSHVCSYLGGRPRGVAMPTATFSEGEGGLVFCSADGCTEAEVFAEFRARYTDASSSFGDDSKLLFKVTVDDGHSKTKPLLYAGVAHGARFSEVLALFNQKFCKIDGQEGAFLVVGGYAIKPTKCAGNVFMAYGNELTFHTKVDFSRLAYAS